MESIIEKGSFIHDDKSVADAFQLELDSWREQNKDKLTAGQVISGFRTIGMKLLEDKLPTYQTEGWKQMFKAFKTLQGLTESLLTTSPERQYVPDTKQAIVNMGLQMVSGITDLSEFQELFYTMMVDWFFAGPSTLSLIFVKSLLSHPKLGMREYMKNLKDEKLTKLLEAVTSPVVKKELTSDKDFYSAYKVQLEELISTSLSKTEMKTRINTTLMIDFPFHLNLDYTHLDMASVDVMGKMAKTISKMYKEQWETFSDLPRLKLYLGKISALAKTPGFPRNGVIATMVSESLNTVIIKAQKSGLVETLARDVFDLMEILEQADGQIEQVLKVFSTAVVFFKQQNYFKNSPTLFMRVVPRFVSLLSSLDFVFLTHTKLVSVMMRLVADAYADNKDLMSTLVTLCVPLIKRPTTTTWDECRWVLSKLEKTDWKDQEQFVREFLNVLIELEIPSNVGVQKWRYDEPIKDCLNYVAKGLKKARTLKTYGKQMMYVSVHLLEMKPWSNRLFEAAINAGEHIDIDVKEHRDAVMKVMSRLHDIIQDDEMPLKENGTLRRAISAIIRLVAECAKDDDVFSEEDLEQFTSMCVTCLEKDPMDLEDRNETSHHFDLAERIMEHLIPWLGAAKKHDITRKLVPLLLRMIADDEYSDKLNVGYKLWEMSHQNSEVLVPFFDEIMRMYLARDLGDRERILDTLNEIYTSNRVFLKDNFQVLFAQMLGTKNKNLQSDFTRLMWEASKKESPLFTEDNMKDLIVWAKSDKQNQGMCLQIISGVAKRGPAKVVKHLELLMRKNGWDPMLVSIINDVLCTLALFDKNVAEKVVNRSIDMVRHEAEKHILVTALNSVRQIGFKYPDVIKPKRRFIESLQFIDGDALSMQQYILDLIDGKTPEYVRNQLDAQQEAVSDLVERVDDVEGAMEGVVGEMEGQRQELDNVRNDVTDHSQRLDKVEVVVDGTVKKMDEMDNKTLSHAPYWSRDVSAILNPVSDHDWRLLSSRLGYSDADIRGWAQHTDPCTAMLNDWYAQKMREATHEVLTHLQEMNRDDASLIVENTLKGSATAIEGREFEYASPPEIFISYHWGHRQEVNLLHRHLTMAGYDCWMDIGQMGGGEKLLGEIDKGMRAAKLVICCVTSEYATSPNCNKEVNLAMSMNKPIIPLLLENCSWPPQGSMGPTFRESLCILFYRIDQEGRNDGRFWSDDKFRELLMQLSVKGLTPDEGKIDAVYRNWWLPLEEETQSGAQSLQPTQTSSDNQAAESPDVFISYQWEKKKNVIKLYKRLTSLGYSCWLDIKQMEGRESLYDKIERGIRGSKVVVSCVTKEYILSPNSRRELSLADSLKKPVLPLLLEEMTWPPSGPMEGVMTHLFYIGFQQEAAQTKWKGPPFDELVSKINQCVPANPSIRHRSPPPNTDCEASSSDKDSQNAQDKFAWV